MDRILEITIFYTDQPYDVMVVCCLLWPLSLLGLCRRRGSTWDVLVIYLLVGRFIHSSRWSWEDSDRASVVSSVPLSPPAKQHSWSTYPVLSLSNL